VCKYISCTYRKSFILFFLSNDPLLIHYRRKQTRILSKIEYEHWELNSPVSVSVLVSKFSSFRSRWWSRSIFNLRLLAFVHWHKNATSTRTTNKDTICRYHEVPLVCHTKHNTHSRILYCLHGVTRGRPLYRNFELRGRVREWLVPRSSEYSVLSITKLYICLWRYAKRWSLPWREHLCWFVCWWPLPRRRQHKMLSSWCLFRQRNPRNVHWWVWMHWW